MDASSAAVVAGRIEDTFRAIETARMAGIPILVVRGAISDILAPGCVAEMRRRRPDLVAVEVPRRGHAPMLDEREASAAIRAFVRGLD